MDQNSGAGGCERWTQLGYIWKVEATFSGGFQHLCKCIIISGTVPGSLPVHELSVSNNHSDTNPFHSAPSGFLAAASWAKRGFDQC